MALKLHNTLGNKFQTFKPVELGIVRMYNCGPTVYDYAHIGNFRTFLFNDILRRYLEYKGYKVEQVMNITDVGHMTSDSDEGEDRLEVAARREKKDPWEISRKYTKAFFEDMEKLNALKAKVYPRATDHIKEMIEMVKLLIDKGYGYVVDGNVYFDVSKFEDYGKLSGNKPKNLKAGARLEVREDKKNPFDFALWKSDPKHLMKWKSPWTKNGFPGWHIECSAMSAKHLTDAFKGGAINPKGFKTIDIHTGGEDNKFPHHESEIAQTEGAFGKKFSNFWLHVTHLFVEGNKMSKSLGNFWTLKDVMKMGFEPMVIRYLLISTHYRQRLNFTKKGLRDSKESLERINEFLDKVKQGKDNQKTHIHIRNLKKRFEEAMVDDLNVSRAFAALFDFIRDVNRDGGGKKAHDAVIGLDSVFGLKFGKEVRWLKLKDAPKEIREKIERREKFRKAKEWEKADKIRAELKGKGILLEDTPKRTVWRKA